MARQADSREPTKRKYNHESTKLRKHEKILLDRIYRIGRIKRREECRNGDAVNILT